MQSAGIRLGPGGGGLGRPPALSGGGPRLDTRLLPPCPRTEGAGKTTILRLLLGLQHPGAGKTLVEGREWSTLSRANRAHIRQRIGYVQQQVGLLQAPALYNVTLPLRWRGVCGDVADECGKTAM